MEEKVLQIIRNYAENNKPIDNSFIESIIHTIVDSWELNEYMEKILFYNGDVIISDSAIYTFDLAKLPFSIQTIKKYINKSVSAIYSSDSAKLHVFIQTIKKDLNNKVQQMSFNSKNELNYFNCLFYLIIILHELEHMKQKKETMLKPNSLESELIHLSFGTLKTSNNKTNSYESSYSQKTFKELYNKYYKFCPIERLANIKSYKKTKIILSMIKESFPNINNYINFGEIMSQVDAYNQTYINSLGFSHLHQQFIDKKSSFYNKIVFCPTYLWLCGLKLQNEWPKFDYYTSNYQQKIKDCQERYSLDD